MTAQLLSDMYSADEDTIVRKHMADSLSAQAALVGGKS